MRRQEQVSRAERRHQRRSEMQCFAHDRNLDSRSSLAAFEDILWAAARDFADNAVSDNTNRAYEAAWSSITGFTAALNRSGLPAKPQTVVDYAAHLAP